MSWQLMLPAVELHRAITRMLLKTNARDVEVGDGAPDSFTGLLLA
jgi:hypothetical protein